MTEPAAHGSGPPLPASCPPRVVGDQSAGERLTAALAAAAEAGLPIPCAGRDEWISDSPATRHSAAVLCQGCPVLLECEATADAGAEWGAWAGRDRPGTLYQRARNCAELVDA